MFCPWLGDWEAQGGFLQPSVAKQWANRDAKAAWLAGKSGALASTDTLTILVTST